MIFCFLDIISNKLSFILLAPWLPPKNNTIGLLSFNLFSFNNSFFLSSDIFTFFTLVGVPVTTTCLALGNLFFASSNPTNTFFALFESIFTATPGKALLSCNTTGTFLF